ncbi:MAG: sulfite exporter TauE/SafE family protein, partial [Pseudomonadota bacterium]
MLSSIPWGEVALLIAVLGVAGLVSGVLAGMFGVGGGAILVPVLYQFFQFVGVPEEVRMHLSVGTSLAIIIPT